jgi:hypothetical protein
MMPKTTMIKITRAELAVKARASTAGPMTHGPRNDSGRVRLALSTATRFQSGGQDVTSSATCFHLMYSLAYRPPGLFL